MNTKKNRTSISLTVIITLIISLCMLIPCIVSGTYMYITLKNQTLSSIKKSLDTSSESAFASLDSRLHSIKNTYYSIISDPIINPELYNYVFSSDNRSSNESVDERLTKMMFYNTTWSENILNSVTLTNDLHTFQYISNRKSGAHLDQTDLTFLNELMQLWKTLDTGSPDHRINILTHSKSIDNTIIYYRDYYSYPENEFKGLLNLQIDEKKLMSVFDDLSDKYTDTLCFIYNNDGTLIAGNSEILEYENIAHAVQGNISLQDMMNDSENYITHTSTLNSFPVTACLLIPLQPIYQELQRQLSGFFIIFSILLVVVILIALIVSRTVSSYINLLIRRMTLLSQGNYTLTLPKYGITELNNLSATFTGMSKKIQWLLNEKYANEVLLKESELKALQAQINPHFLFNTLLSISWTARKNNDMECYDMTTSLSSLLKANIYTTSSKFVSLRNELMTVQNYLKIQKIRFSQKLSYDIDVDAKLLEQPILKLCLQPIVENAVTHGLENKLSDGLIIITGDLTDSNEVIIKITDNGIGFNSEPLNRQLQDLNTLTQLKNEEPPSGNNHHHIGLINTQIRLKYTYGEQYGITIQSTPGEGTSVVIIFPGESSISTEQSGENKNV